MMRLETKSLASLETLSKVSSSKYQLAARTLLSVSVSSSPKKGERPLSLGVQGGEESGALRLQHLPDPLEQSQSRHGCSRDVLPPSCALACSWAEPLPAPKPHTAISPSRTLYLPPSSQVPGDNSAARGAVPQHHSSPAWHWQPPPSPNVQHVGDDAHAPHVRGVGDLLVVDHLRGEEFRGAKVHFQLLIGIVPAAEKGCKSAGGGQAAPPNHCPSLGRCCPPQLVRDKAMT